MLRPKGMTMHLPKISAPLVLSGIALAVSLGGATAAATGLINGASIRPGTITGRQIKNHSVPVVKLSTPVPTSFPKYLPAGTTVRGAYEIGGSAAAAGDFFYMSVSWFWSLRSPVNVQYVAPTGPSTVQCPGSFLAPTAARGYLCLYSRAALNAILPPYATGTTAAGVTLTMGSRAAGLTLDRGSWAVTGN